jgi:hypothetical protein
MCSSRKVELLTESEQRTLFLKKAPSWQLGAFAVPGFGPKAFIATPDEPLAQRDARAFTRVSATYMLGPPGHTRHNVLDTPLGSPHQAGPST